MYRRAGGQQDYLIRMIQQAGEVLRRLRGRAAEGAPAVELIDTARSAQAALFGERAAMLQRLDAASAVFLIGDDEAVRMWIELLREEAAAHRAGDDPDGAARIEQRAMLLERALPAE